MHLIIQINANERLYLQYKLKEHSYIIAADPDNMEVEVNSRKVRNIEGIYRLL